MNPFRPASLAAITTLLLAGCAVESPSVPIDVKKSRTVKILDVGGDSSESTQPFTVKGRRIRVDFRLGRATQLPQVSIVALRDNGGDRFDPVTTVSRPTSGGLSGSATMSLIPGRYRLRVETDVPWTATIFESTQ